MIIRELTMEGFCRACLNKFNEPTDLLQYCESNRRLFVYCTGLQVKRNDTFTFQLCKECYLNLKFSCKFKKQCRTSNKKFKTYLALKENGSSIDFSTYIKNIEDTLSLRLPVASSGSTPAHHKNYDDDDNESTCTSIQNFMSDMLQGEEMLPTEARIIREVIEEEADILDDSLDSHWLQDDVSIENDLGMDFNFAGFSTPRSINNDHRYTPRRLTNDREDSPYYYSPKDTIQNLEGIHDHKDMPLLDNLDIAENNNLDRTDSKYDLNIIVSDKQTTNTQYQNDMPLLEDCDIKLDGIVEDFITMDDLETGYHIESTVQPKNNDITIILNKGVASKVTNSPLTNELEYYMNKVELNKMSDTSKLIKNEKNIDAVNTNKTNTINQLLPIQDFDQFMGGARLNLNQVKNIEHVDSTVKFELDQYINKAELKKKTNIASNQNKNSKKYDEKCSIDRNLEKALKNDVSQEFSLDQLLISPQVSIRSGASTPTINNILFGNLTPRDIVAPDMGNNVVEKEPKPTDFIEEFMINVCQRQSTKKESKEVERRFIKVKDINKMKESKVKIQRKITKSKCKRNRGYKDIKKLKDLLTFENDNHSDNSDIEMLDSEQTQSITEAELIDNKESIEFVDENLYNTSGSEILDNVQSLKITDPIIIKDTVHIKTENHCETLDSEIMNNETLHQVTEPSDNKEVINQIPKKDDDLDISISNLLRFDDNQSVDLNISIASDFLKDETLEEDNNDNNLKEPEYVFKMPFSPPDNKYDLDKNLCKICDRTYKTKGALKIHFVKIHKLQIPRKKKNRKAVPKICPKCGKGYRDQSNFNKHMKHHEEPDCIKCEFCTLDFPSRGRYNQHMKTHASEIAKMESEVQDKDGKENSREEGKQTKILVCITCGKTFKTSGNYNIHIRRHNKNYTIKCPICQKGFVRKCDLDAHMGTHNKEHPFKCQYCPKTYRSRHLLVGHMYRHLGKEVFKCEVCDRQFISSQYLRQHYRTEMCVQNRKALEEGQEAGKVTVTYKPTVYKPPKRSQKIGKKSGNVTENGLIDTIEKDCLESIEEGIKNEPSICRTAEDIACTGRLESLKSTENT